MPGDMYKDAPFILVLFSRGPLLDYMRLQLCSKRPLFGPRLFLLSLNEEAPVAPGGIDKEAPIYR